MCDVEDVRRLLQASRLEQAERLLRLQRRRVVDVLVAAGPQAHGLDELGHGKPDRTLGLEADLPGGGAGGRRGGHPRPGGESHIGGGVGHLDRERGARRLRGDETHTQQVEEGELVLRRRTLEASCDRLQIADDDLGERPVGTRLLRKPLRHVTRPERLEPREEVRRVADREDGRPGGNTHAGAPSSR